MDTSTSLTQSKRAVSFRTPSPPVRRVPRAVAMPSWRTHAAPPPECLVIVIGLPRGACRATVSVPRVRQLHAYGSRGASALCGASNWRELVPPDETTCPLCRARLGRVDPIGKTLKYSSG